jgi:hypothetical protein
MNEDPLGVLFHARGNRRARVNVLKVMSSAEADHPKQEIV